MRDTEGRESLMDKREVARLLRVSPATVDRELRDGALQHVKVRGGVRFRECDIRQYLADRTRVKAAEG